jgi:predicted O-linked N-acetylglucosamine transferase (SPINDLY family)
MWSGMETEEARQGGDTFLSRAKACFRAKHYEQAAAWCRTSLRHGQEVVPALTLLGTMAGLLGVHADALVLLRLAVGIDPKDVPALNALGVVLSNQNRHGEARSYFEQALALDPDRDEALRNYAHSLYKLREFSRARSAFEKFLRTGCARSKDFINYGWTLQKLGLNEKAARIFQILIMEDPSNSEGWFALAFVAYELKKVVAAIALYTRTIAADPLRAPAYTNLVAIYLRHGNLDAGARTSRACLQACPGNTSTYINYAPILAGLGKTRDAVSAFQRALEADPQNYRCHSNLLFYQRYLGGIGNRELFDAHRVWNNKFGRRFESLRRPFANVADPRRRLRVGYVSSDFWSHSCAYFLRSAAFDYDRDGFEVTCYSNVDRPDGITERFRQSVDRWRDTNGLEPETLVEQIRADGIDILVDLNGHTARHFLLAFTAHPAPVQVTWLGYPGTTGLDAMDYRLSDRWLTPEGGPEPFSERLYRMDRISHCYTAPDGTPEVAPLPAARNGYVTFGSFNTFAKLSDDAVVLWSAVLEAVPTARLALKSRSIGSPEARAHIFDRFRAQGTDLERILFLGGQEKQASHLAMYELVDIALDTTPYGGMTTSCEALWMGVPVVTLAGDRTSSRYGASVLEAVGLPHLIASSPEDFVAIARRAAADVGALAELRAGLRARMAASPLCDVAGFARALERAYRDLWSRWCASSGRE